MTHKWMEEAGDALGRHGTTKKWSNYLSLAMSRVSIKGEYVRKWRNKGVCTKTELYGSPFPLLTPAEKLTDLFKFSATWSLSREAVLRCYKKQTSFFIYMTVFLIYIFFTISGFYWPKECVFAKRNNEPKKEWCRWKENVCHRKSSVALGCRYCKL